MSFFFFPLFPKLNFYGGFRPFYLFIARFGSSPTLMIRLSRALGILLKTPGCYLPFSFPFFQCYAVGCTLTPPMATANLAF